MHPVGRLCKLPRMTVLTSASYVKVTPRPDRPKNPQTSSTPAAGNPFSAEPVLDFRSTLAGRLGSARFSLDFHFSIKRRLDEADVLSLWQTCYFGFSMRENLNSHRLPLRCYRFTCINVLEITSRGEWICNTLPLEFSEKDKTLRSVRFSGQINENVRCRKKNFGNTLPTALLAILSLTEGNI